MTTCLAKIDELARKYDVPCEDALFIDFNRKGISFDTDLARVRFHFRLSDNPAFAESQRRGERDFFFGMPTHSGTSNYYLRGENVYLDDDEIGQARGVVNDTCDSTYARKMGYVFVLNSKSKSTCSGCKFCHTYRQTSNDVIDMELKCLVPKLMGNWLEEYGVQDLSHLDQISVITGCFGSEQAALDHLFIVREAAEKFGYKGKILYFGSEIASEASLERLKQIAPFGFCLSLECFGDREKILRPQKAAMTLSHAKDLLEAAKALGFESRFSYVLGLEPLGTMAEGMSDFLPFMNDFPVVNVFQPHTERQRDLLVPEAGDLTYFLEARKVLEGIFGPTPYRPAPWENYRYPWSLKFGKENITDVRVPNRYAD